MNVRRNPLHARLAIRALHASLAALHAPLASLRANHALRATRALRVIACSIACAAASIGVTGCVGNDTVVFVDPDLEDMQVAVASKALGTDLTGSFRLALLLGPRASGASQVTAQSFAIVNGDETKTLIQSLETKADKTFPVTVELDSEVSVNFTIDLGGALLPASAATEICGAGGIKITGTIQDSLESGATPVTSALFQPTGCP